MPQSRKPVPKSQKEISRSQQEPYVFPETGETLGNPNIPNSFEQFTKAGRTELAAQEKKEMDIIKSYLPEEMTETEIVDAVKNSITNCQADSIKDMGKVMADIRKTHGENADMGLVSKYVKQLLTS